MSTNNSQNDAIVQMINKMDQTIFNRVVSGEFDYDHDLATLERYVKTTEELAAYEQLFWLYRTIGTLHRAAGFPSRSIAANQNGAEINAAYIKRPIVQVGFSYNIALALMDLNRYRQALQRLTRLHDEFMAIEDAMRSYGYLLMMIISDTVLCHLALGQVAAAVEANAKLTELGMSITYNRQYTRGLIKLWGASSELQLAQGKLPEAWSSANLGYEQALALNDATLKTQLTFTQLHIIAAAPSIVSDPAAYHQQLDLGLSAIKSPAGRGVLYLYEARWQLRHDNSAAAHQYAALARTEFETGESDEGVELVAMLEKELS